MNFRYFLNLSWGKNAFFSWSLASFSFRFLLYFCAPAVLVDNMAESSNLANQKKEPPWTCTTGHKTNAVIPNQWTVSPRHCQFLRRPVLGGLHREDTTLPRPLFSIKSSTCASVGKTALFQTRRLLTRELCRATWRQDSRLQPLAWMGQKPSSLILRTALLLMISLRPTASTSTSASSLPSHQMPLRHCAVCWAT